MKLTPELKLFLSKQSKHYCKFLKLNLPSIIYTDEELLKIGLKPEQIRKIRQYELGRSWPKGSLKDINKDIIFLNLDDSDFLWQMVDILVHELVHIKYQNFRHGSKFQNTVNNIIVKTCI